MKNILGVFLMMTVVSIGNLLKASASEEHHKDTVVQEQSQKKKSSEESGRMGHMMDMEKMKGMMKECMVTHNDGKMCDHSMMSKCQEHMGKNDCQKMMKKMNSEKK